MTNYKTVRSHNGWKSQLLSKTPDLPKHPVWGFFKTKLSGTICTITFFPPLLCKLRAGCCSQESCWCKTGGSWILAWVILFATAKTTAGWVMGTHSALTWDTCTWRLAWASPLCFPVSAQEGLPRCSMCWLQKFWVVLWNPNWEGSLVSDYWPLTKSYPGNMPGTKLKITCLWGHKNHCIDRWGSWDGKILVSDGITDFQRLACCLWNQLAFLGQLTFLFQENPSLKL